LLLEKANIKHMGRGFGPRVHDFRHTMAVHRLNQWATEKRDISVMLPILAVYLGHENVRISSYYLRLTAQVYPKLTAQFERDFGETIPDIAAKEWEALREYD
jgi:integrase